MKQVLVDIDGVLACDNRASYLAICNHAFKLGLDQIQLSGLSLKEFDVLASEYIQKVGEDKYQKQLKMLQWHPDHIVRLSVIQHALEGVQFFHQIADDLGYCTARTITFDEQWNNDLARLTKIWLLKNSFPNYNTLFFCDKHLGKLKLLAQLLRGDPNLEIWLIDDNADILFGLFDQLEKEDRAAVTRRLTLVGFGFEETCAPIKILPSWEQSEMFIEKEFAHEMPNLQARRSSVS